MHPGTAAFIIVMMSISTVGWLINSWIRTKHSARSESHGQGGLEAARQIELLSNENSGLKGQVGRLEERISVLERIATDPAERTARAIDNLR